ncbi:hypothetical protein FPZ12_016985 [Amycolatopsis acidicola]|uniref:Uncharacterized protein n=1 Tax=Amycolatopsis acidicola TaxID=2596893 RepID=A0A5N0V575_9PSEU|nr:hypothetical protein [Amycolatopsis acidicola]KAA9160528.1 hypothetical protein FPZ12_016985 [Amycolatopsis acidicola]
MKSSWKAALPCAALLTLLAAAPANAATTDPGTQVAESLAAGDGEAAAAAIQAQRLDTKPAELGHIIVEGGHIAVSAHTGDQFRDAVAYAFPHGGVSLSQALVTFGLAGKEVVTTGVTPDEALVGGETIAQTVEAYAL